MPESKKLYIICPCYGDIPFLVDSLEEAVNYIMTEEYYAVDIATLELVSEDGTREALKLSDDGVETIELQDGDVISGIDGSVATSYGEDIPQ